MIKQSKEKLLKNSKVIEEINRHKWFESQKLGYDIGFEKAAEQWIKNFSADWLKKTSKVKTRKTVAKKKKTVTRRTRKTNSA